MNVEPGKWYFLVACSGCGRGLPFQEAPSPEEEPAPTISPFPLTCPHCGKADIYQPEQVERSQGRYKQ